MANWKEYKLGEIAEIVMGQSPAGETCNESGNGVPLLNGPTEFGSSFPTPVQFTTDPKKFAKPLDILFCVRGSTTGKMNWADRDYAIGRGLAAIRHREGKKYRHFIKGLIDANLSLLLQSATGSTFPNVSKDQLNSTPILAPDLGVQESISEILSSLNDKIELNNQINKNLEALAEALFKQWFIDFEFPNEYGQPYKSSGGEMIWSELGEIPKGWIADKLGDHLYIKGRIGWKGLKKSDYLPDKSGYAIVNGSDFVDEQIDLKKGGWIPKDRYDESPEIQLQVSDILITKDGTIGKLAYIHKLAYPTSVASGIFVVRVGSKKLSTYYCWSFFKSPYFQNLVKSRIEGTVIPHLYQRDFVEMLIPLPPPRILQKFETAVSEIFQTVFNNKDESIKLASLRDVLLPKLISGELEPNQ